MLIKSEQLDNNLNNLQNLYCLFGVEKLLIQHSLDKIKTYLYKQEFVNKIIFNIDAKFDFSKLMNELITNDLFTDKKLIQININNLNIKTTKNIINIINNIKSDVVVIMVIEKITKTQQQSKWFKAINNLGLVIQHFEIYPNQMFGWIKQQMNNIGLSENIELAKIISEFNQNNLLSANNELQKLKFAYGAQTINANDYKKQINQQSVHNIYNLIDNALIGNTQKILTIYNNSNIEHSYLLNLLYAQIKQLITINIKLKKQIKLSTALDESGVWKNKTKIIVIAVKRHSYQQLQKILLLLGRIDRSIKGRDNLNINDLLLKALLLLSGINNGLNN